MAKAKPPILMRKEAGRLVPIDPWAREQIDALPEGKDLHVRASERRTHGLNGLYWAGLGLLVDNFDEADAKMWRTSKRLHKTLLCELGYVERIYRIDGTFTEQADSVAFDEMDEADFKELFEHVRAMVVKRWRYDPWDLWKANRDLQH